jgi:exonuclease SbcC
VRPLSLSFTGLRSYDTFGPVSFDDRSLVGILGDTGAGKSTILEALCVALYGKCSWSDRDVKDLIADGAPTMTVDLTFHHDEHRWRIRRTFYTNTMPSTALLQNLDTGAQVDNIRPVDKAIVAMLRMDFTAFRSAVLLPQGRFATLLHATDRERTDLLKGIFGVDTVALVREFAQARRIALGDLLQEAAVARAAMLPDPAAEAVAAAARAERAERQTAELTEDITRLRGLQSTTAIAVKHADEITTALRAVNDAADDLDRGKIASLVDTAATIEDELASAERDTTASERQETDQLDTAEAALAAADAAGTGPTQLAAALATLERLPAESEAVGTEQARITAEGQRLAAERARLDAAAADEPARERDVAQVSTTAATLQQHYEDVQNAVTELASQVSDVLNAAAAAASQAEELQELSAQAATVTARLPELELQAEGANEALNAARLGVEAAQRAEAAAVAGEHLHAGDNCPVCASPIPSPYTPPPPADADALSTAQTSYQDASDALSSARSQREEAQRRLRELTDTAASKDRAVQTARTAVAASLEEMTGWTALATLAAPIDDVAWPDGVSSPTPILAITVRDDLAAGLSRITEHRDGDGGQRRQLLEQLLVPARRYGADLRTAAAGVDAAAATARAEFTSEQRDLKRQETGYQREADAFADAQRRLASTVSKIAEAVGNLPSSVRAPLPDLPGADQGLASWLADLTDQQIAAARAVLDAAIAAIAGHERDRAAAQRQLRDLAQTRSTISRRREAEVAAPLRQAVRAYESAAAALRGARTCEPELPEPDAVPVDLTPTAVRGYGQAIVAHLTHAGIALSATKGTADGLADQSRRSLAAALSAALARIADAAGDLTIPDPEDATLLTAATLDPLTNARGVTGEQARTARAEEQAAADQVARAAALDEAIAAGELRRATLDDLHLLLAEGKFQTDLTERRTRALLGVASELFSRLSGGEFGYAEQFQVVARRTGVARSAKTLSGGETFLASLALALALVELYSRTAGRLGALFLDEGFGSLDVDTLAAALEVLRAETGGDKLVAVISHLHAVAEAVQDVLWVEKGSSGSAARWLTGEQIADLVHDDAAAGLLSLT